MCVLLINNIFKFSSYLLIRNMSVLTPSFNVTSGKLEWEFQSVNYDWHQEVARSGYADMLHDTERNRKYYNGLKASILQLKRKGKTVRVLDIGAGTGLLSMMAVMCGADTVTACEAFEPIAKCALSIIESNGMAEKITLVQKRSTALKVGKDCDLKQRANILVAEVFDTELIGEGALSTFKHALDNLLEPGCLVIPSSATVYAQVIESEGILDWSRTKKLELQTNTILNIPNSVMQCPGLAGVHDIQMSQLQKGEFKALTDPVVVHVLDFTGKIPLKLKESIFTETTSLAKGKCQAVFMWWDLEMTPSGETLSCAPYWAHRTPNSMQWRDHWMQGVYYLPIPSDLEISEPVVIGTHHDEYSYWFSIQKKEAVEHPVCICGLHITNSRTRIGMMNDRERAIKLYNAYKKILRPEWTCLYLGESIPSVLMISKLPVKKVFICEPNRMKRELLKHYLECNGNNCLVTILEKDPLHLDVNDIGNNLIDVLLSEPYFNNSVLPWDNIHFWYLASTLRPLLSSSVKLAPQSAKIHGVAIQLQDLWKIRAPVQQVEGFDLTIFDQMIQQSIEISDPEVEPHPLWEYPGVALSTTFELAHYDFTKDIVLDAIHVNRGSVNFKSGGTCNAIALWIEYQLEDEILSTGPISEIIPGEMVQWYRHYQQGVYFIKKPVKDAGSLSFECTFKAKNGTTVFNFNFFK